MVGLWVISGFFPFIFINYSIRDLCYLHNMFLSFFYYFRRVFEILKIILQHSDIQVDQQPVNKRTVTKDQSAIKIKQGNMEQGVWGTS